MEKRVYLSSCESYEYECVKSSIQAILAKFGGAKRLAGGKRVLIKPNLLMPRNPDDHTTTHPCVIKALAEEFMAAGCAVTIADSCGGPYNTTVLKLLYKKCELQQIADETGAQLNLDTSYKTIDFPGGDLIKSFPVITPAADSEFIITTAKLKTHMMTHMTGAVKNLYGCIPGLTKAVYHSKLPDRRQFCRMLVDLCECVSPSFAVIDGVYGMEGRGPSGGRPKKAGVILGGINPHAVDLAASRVMGLDTESIYTLSEAEKREFIPPNARDLDYSGSDPSRFEFKFLPPSQKGIKGIGLMPKFMRPFLTRLSLPLPKISERCVGCGDCTAACPEQIITIENKRAIIDRSKCIKCYCCHELCPYKAIDI